MGKYVLVDSLKSQTQVSSRANFYMTDLITVGIFFISTFIFKDFVLPALQIPLGIFNLLVGFYLTSPSKTNRGKKNWQSMYIFLVANRDFYYPLKNTNLNKKADDILEDLNEGYSVYED